MKKSIYLLTALLALWSCNKQDQTAATPGDDIITWTFSAVQTKAAIADEGAFSWTEGDALSIWDNTTGQFITFRSTAKEGADVFYFTAEAPRSSDFAFAVYPASAAASASLVSLPSTYAEPAESARAFPMTATIEKGSNSLNFTHLGALLRFTVTGVPADMTRITVSSSDGSISGSFPYGTFGNLFYDSFDWLAEFTTGDGLDPVGDNALGSSTVVSFSTFQSRFEGRGYEQLNPLSTPCIYGQRNYLKFGRNNVQNGLKLPELSSITGTTNAVLSFDWCAHVGNTGKVDGVSMAVELVGGGTCADTGAAISNAFPTAQSGSFAWQHVTLALNGITSSTRICIRPALSGYTNNGYYRFHLDNIALSDESVSGETPSIAFRSGGTSDVTLSLPSHADGAEFTVTLPMPVGSYNYQIAVGTESDPNVYTASSKAAQTFARKKIYNLGALNFQQ